MAASLDEKHRKIRLQVNDELSIAHINCNDSEVQRIISQCHDRKFAVNTSLYWACRFRTVDVVKMLFENKDADFVWTNEVEENRSFLHVACWNGDCEIIMYLLSKE